MRCPPSDRLKMEAARSIREDFLHQNSFHEIDTYTSLRKQYLMMKLVLAFYDESAEGPGKGRRRAGADQDACAGEDRPLQIRGAMTRLRESIEADSRGARGRK